MWWLNAGARGPAARYVRAAGARAGRWWLRVGAGARARQRGGEGGEVFLTPVVEVRAVWLEEDEEATMTVGGSGEAVRDEAATVCDRAAPATPSGERGRGRGRRGGPRRSGRGDRRRRRVDGIGGFAPIQIGQRREREECEGGNGDRARVPGGIWRGSGPASWLGQACWAGARGFFSSSFFS